MLNHETQVSPLSIHEHRRGLTLVLSGFLAFAFAVFGLGQPVSAAELTPDGSSACDFPTVPASTPEETAWRLFVAATCPTGGMQPLAFEQWTEQSCLRGSSDCTSGGAATRRLHASHLALRRTTGGLSANDCTPMTGTEGRPASTSLEKFVPTNLSADATFCEEVFANPSEVAYIKNPSPGHSLRTLTGQAQYVASGNTIKFPTDAIEIKADWLPANSLTPSPIDCNDPNLPVYTEVIKGTCYALAGIHISSKLFPKWLWATFEPQFNSTNPNLCNPELYSSCSDPWGSSPATSTGEPRDLTPALVELMNHAKLAPAFRNYRLVGVQTDFVNSNTTLMGNSFVEFNAGVPAQQASCISCHFSAQFDSSASPPVENPNFGNFPGTPSVGVPTTTQPPVPPGSWQHQDFSWLLGTMPAGSGSESSRR